MYMSHLHPIHLTLALAMVLAMPCALFGEEAGKPDAAPEKGRNHGPACFSDDHFFADEVWPKVAAQSCLKCHKAGGDAEDTKLVLEDPAREKTQATRCGTTAPPLNGSPRSAPTMSRGFWPRRAAGWITRGSRCSSRIRPAYRILSEFVRQVNDPEHARGPAPKLARHAEVTAISSTGSR